MKRRRRVWVAAVTIAAVLLCLIPASESTFEFDEVNFRLRSCSRTRTWLFGWLLRERCGEPADHPTAARLREMGVLGAASDADARWVLIKGFKPGARGWHGRGRYYLDVLGMTTFGTPVPLPAEEDLSKNLWVAWARGDPEAAGAFWRHFRADVAGTELGDLYLRLAYRYVDDHNLDVKVSELLEHLKTATSQL